MPANSRNENRIPEYLAAGADGATLKVRVTPRAGRSAVTGVRDGALAVRVAAAPVDGAANAALTEFLAGVLGLPRRSVVLISGERGRDKRLKILGVSAAAVAARLAPLV